MPVEEWMRYLVALVVGAGGVGYFIGLERRMGNKVDRKDLEHLMENSRSEIHEELRSVKVDIGTLVEKEEKREEKTSTFRHDMRNSMHSMDLKIERFIRECAQQPQRRSDDR